MPRPLGPRQLLTTPGNRVDPAPVANVPPPVVPTRLDFQNDPPPGPVTLAPLNVANGAPVQQRAVFEVVPRQPLTVIEALARLDQLEGVEVETLGDIDGIAVQCATVSGAPPPAGVEPRRVLITGGVHGSEPAGTLSAVSLLALVAEHPEQFPGLQFTVVPLVNPEGFRDGTRRNENDGVDLNREAVRDGSMPKEIQLVLPVLDRGPWSLALDLHASGSTTADGDNGFFAIRTEGNDTLLHDVLTEFKARWPVLDETTQRYEMVEPGVMESHNEGTLKGYLFAQGTSAAFTLEAPALSGVDAQVTGMLELVQGFLKRVT